MVKTQMPEGRTIIIGIAIIIAILSIFKDLLTGWIPLIGSLKISAGIIIIIIFFGLWIVFSIIKEDFELDKTKFLAIIIALAILLIIIFSGVLDTLSIYKLSLQSLTGGT